MKLKWTSRALSQFKEALDYIADDNPDAARAVGQRIWDASRLLLEQPNIGRPGRVAGTYEWVVKRTPYLIAYTLDTETLIILRVIHGELLKLGINVSEAVVSKYMIRHPKPPSQTWRTFLENHATDFFAIDFLTVPTANYSGAG